MSIISAKQSGEAKVAISGFVYNKRVHKGLIFIDLRDLSGVMQVVFEEKNAEAFAVAAMANLESYLTVSGTLQAKPKGKNQENQETDYELLASEAEMVSLAGENLPIPVLVKADNEADLENRLDWRFLDLRQPKNQLIFKVWTELEKGIRDYFYDNNYIQIYTPTLMNTASESGADVFEVKYFDRKAYLGQSPQFYKQMALMAGLEKVFMVGSIYRAEKSFTTRHVTEFTGLDFEIADIESHHDIMAEQEKMLVAGFQTLKNKLLPELEVPTIPFPKLTMKEAKAKLVAVGIKGEEEGDLSSEEEKGIAEIIKKEFNHDFVFITDYPISVRPFYHMRSGDDLKLTKSADLLYKGLEISTCAQREHRIEILEKQAITKDMNLEELKDYLNFFRYGAPTHGGVGFGLSRIIMKILNLNSVKEVIFLPRDVKRLTP